MKVNRTDPKKTAVLGMILTTFLIITLIMILLLPWLVIKNDDSESKEVKVMDFWGNGYLGKDGEDEVIIDNDEWDEYDELDNGRWFPLIGVIIGLLLGIVLIVFGYLKSENLETDKAFSITRSIIGVGLIIPSTFLMVGGSKFIGLCVSSSSLGQEKLLIFPIQPLINSLFGIVVLILSLVVISYEIKNI